VTDRDERAEFDAVQAATSWLAAEPDADIREELQELLDGDPAALSERFAGNLTFGTAGLRAAVGAGPLRMNRLVVRQAAAGLAAHLESADPGATRRGVVIGYDARRKSDVFAHDTARVMAAAGIKAMLLPDPLPTPVLAWSVTELDAAAGVMVTASHNPPTDNGYKVYLGDGAQIVPPHDLAIAEQIARVDPTGVPLAVADDALITMLDDGVTAAYLASTAEIRLRPDVAPIHVAYTPLHGTGGETACTAFELAGFERPDVVAEQFDPDSAFPTVSFPNPEEPGALDLLLALADEVGADLAIANDPDADRLGAAIPQPDGSWRRLGGDEIGWLLADHILANTTGDDRMVVTTLVSSSLLGDMAKSYGVHAKETYTGFKWIARTILDNPGLRFVFGYEQALGYLVAPRPLDKDGISAAVMLAEVAAVATAEGTTLQARLDDIAARYGRHVTIDKSVRMDPVAAAKAVERMQARPPTEIGGARVVDVVSFPEADLLRLELAGGVRVQVRPSGTEPKVKIYGEAVNADPVPYVDSLISLI
jgi:phosphomannomutase